MFRLDDDWVFSATDLVTALRCEYQVLRRRAEKDRLVDALVIPADEIQARAGKLGEDHEANVLRDLIERYGEGAPGGVVSIARPSTQSRASLEAAHAATLAAFRDGAQVVFQAAFFDGRFHGLADFVVRTPGADGSVSYEPADTKFARHARVEALVQLASYAYELEGMGLPRPEQVHLWLGDGAETHHRYADLRPVLIDRWDRMVELLERPPGAPTWDDPTVRQCGRCAYCQAAAEERRDLLLVAGMRVDHRKRLAAAGVTTVDHLAALDEAPEGFSPGVFERLHAQARLQAGQDATVDDDHPDGVVTAELADPVGIARVPAPNPGDVFFDFEGDPLHLTEGWTDLGLEYLFGVMTHGPDGKTDYWPLWAHDRRAERLALEEFLDWITRRRRQPGFEGLHIYHYAPYEVTALKRLVQRYGTRADELDALLRDNVFVDLYSVVRQSIRVSQRSYSIKKLEPLYMGDELRESEVTGGAESIVWYAEFQAHRALGEADRAAAKLEALRSYNEYDCLSTLRLRDWLITRPGAVRPTAEPVAPAPEPAKANPARDLAEQLRAPLIDLPPAERTPTQQATAMLAAALEYHRREVLPFWWDHFRRIGAPVEDWEHDGEMIVLDPDRITVLADWHRPAKRFERTFEAVVELSGSFKLLPGERSLFAIHDAPLPSHVTRPEGLERGYAGTITLDALEPVGDRCRATFTETLPGKVTELDPSTPPSRPRSVPMAGSRASPWARRSTRWWPTGSPPTAPCAPSPRSTCCSGWRRASSAGARFPCRSRASPSPGPSSMRSCASTAPTSRSRVRRERARAPRAPR
ncbi:TM0106 family RecB-like putative nuclease [Aquihabitans daechungensis]|uniref:TM0106 family RecB-like putative nuclease n=1 Tax=Aquihabitans daechungensis TaxID=1052257 RepID=UPI003B9E128E